MDSSYRKKLERQGYRFVGEHTGVKVCEWTKKSLRGEGTCYKEKFYGIAAHRCVQMSPAVNFCDHDCIFCWRERNNSGFGAVDDPLLMADRSIDAQRSLLTGFGGNEKTTKDTKSKAKLLEAQEPQHFAISLNGEVTYYPRLSEFITDLKKKGLSSFVVSNGQLPDVLARMEPPTQLYLSLDAPNKKMYAEIDRPMRKDGWERVLASLDVLRDLRAREKTRTVIRVTLIKGLNDSHTKEWAELLERANPHFVEIKSYMFIGASRQRLTLDHMPFHEEVKSFADKISRHCGYVTVDESRPSRVVLLMRHGEENAPWRYLTFPKKYARGKSAPLPKLSSAKLKKETPCEPELTVEQAERLVKIR